MRLFCIMIGAALSSIVHAQMLVDGRKAAYDSLTNTLLATVPERCFHQTAEFTIELQDCWQSCTIDGEPVIGSHLFSNIEAQKGYELMLTDTLGNSVERRLEFTFLPIIELQGSFSNTYVDTLLLFTDPTAHRTDTLAASIKWRGGSTNTPAKHKRNYKIKLDTDTTLLGLRNDDSWILDAGQPDVFRLRNRIAMDVWNRMATPPYYADQEPKARNGVSGKLAEVFLNDAYNGFYNFSENMDRKQMKLKKIDKQTGQIRGCLYKAVSWNKTQLFDSLYYDNTKDTIYGFEVKYPDLQDNDTTDWSPLAQAVNFGVGSNDEDLLNYAGMYFDLPVLTDYHVFISAVNAMDNSGKNTYWAIYNKLEDKRLTPAVWDLDCTFGQRWGGAFINAEEDVTSPYYVFDPDIWVAIRLFYLDEQKKLQNMMNQRYYNLRANGILHTDSLIDLVTYYYETIKNSGAAQREILRWSGDSDLKGEKIDFDAEYKYICNWIKIHLEYVDQLGLPLYYTDEWREWFKEYLAEVNSPKNNFNLKTPTYTLSGQQVANDRLLQQPGIYIRGGRKFIVK